MQPCDHAATCINVLRHRRIQKTKVPRKKLICSCKFLVSMTVRKKAENDSWQDTGRGLDHIL